MSIKNLRELWVLHLLWYLLELVRIRTEQKIDQWVCECWESQESFWVTEYCIDQQTFHVVSIVSLKNLGDLRVLCWLVKRSRKENISIGRWVLWVLRMEVTICVLLWCEASLTQEKWVCECCEFKESFWVTVQYIVLVDKYVKIMSVVSLKNLGQYCIDCDTWCT